MALNSTEDSNEDEDSLYVHCLLRKELFSLYTLLKVTVGETDLHLSRVAMFGFPVYASRLISDPQSSLIVAYDHE